MTAYPAWTPASRPGIIPLHPLTFGTVLARSFAALRHNPRVLLGFALGVQMAAYLVVLLGVGGATFFAFSRLDTLQEGTDDFEAVMAGSIAITAIAGIVLGLAAAGFGVLVQGVVVTEVAHAVLAEKLTLRSLWQQVKPVAWRLIGYAFLLTLVYIVAIALVAAAIFAIGVAALPVAIGLTIVVILASIPLLLWLSTKLLLVPSTIILENATIRAAIVRSWTLIRGRFWPALGVVVLIAVVFSGIAQVISIPFTFLSSGLTTIIAPTGDPQPGAIIAVIVSFVLVQAVTLLVQSVGVVVQSTAAALIYIDCRMRREGLDLDLLGYVERRDAGAGDLADPCRENIGRAIVPRPPAYAGPAYAGPAFAGPAVAGPADSVQQGYPAHPRYPGYPGYPTPSQQGGYPPSTGQPPPGYPPSTGPQPGYPPGIGHPQYPAPQDHAPQYPAPPANPGPPPATPASDEVEPNPPASPAPDRWVAPGRPSRSADPDSPWS